MTSMRFGIMAAQTTPWSELSGFVRFLDRETQFHSAFVVDHMVPGVPGADDSGICFEGWTALAGLAAMTERIRLGVMVTGVTYRNPALLAKMAVTVDHISNGRLELGIGAAWHDAEHRAYGWEFPSVRERQDRLEEAVQLLRLLFERNGRVSFNGKYYQLDQAAFEPGPVQQPRPPIIVGGGGERRTLRTLARYGDVMNTGGTPYAMRQKIAVLEQHCRDAGRDPAEIEKTYQGPIVVSANAVFIDRVAAMIAADGSITADEAKRSMPIGTAAHVRGVVEEYATAGVQRMVSITVPPWKPDIYRRLNDEVVTAFV
jgi:F420-dependent oxidoreductase-like protein